MSPDIQGRGATHPVQPQCVKRRDERSDEPRLGQIDAQPPAANGIDVRADLAGDQP